MSNYLKILLHLKSFEGDGKFHEVEQLFEEITSSELKIVLQELADEEFIKFIGREPRYESFVMEQNILTGKTKLTENPMNEFNRAKELKTLKAKITFKGSKYLKEELEMKKSGKYNISVTGSGANNTFVIESENVEIDNKPTFNIQIEKIIEQITKEKNIDQSTKNQILTTLETAKNEVKDNGSVSSKVAKKILEYGSSISSIGQLVLGLFAS